MPKHVRHTIAIYGQRRPASMEGRLRAFLAGEGDGNDLIQALYAHVLDEPVPERLRAIVGR